MAWYTCPACGNSMGEVEVNGQPVESCPDETCPYHVKPK